MEIKVLELEDPKIRENIKEFIRKNSEGELYAWLIGIVSQNVKVIVAEKSEIVGILVFEEHRFDRFVHIDGILVKVGERNNGIATSLVRHLLSISKNKDKVTVFTSKDNKPMIRVFKKLGFKVKDVKDWEEEEVVEIVSKTRDSGDILAVKYLK